MGTKILLFSGLRFATLLVPACLLYVAGSHAARPEPGWTALHAAAMAGDAKAVRRLLDAPASERSGTVSSAGLAGEQPLACAAASGDVQTVGLLLDRGADVNAADAFGTTALHAAVQLNHADAARLLLGRGANPNLKDRLGRTALHCAGFAHDPAIVRELIDHGANPAARDEFGCTALDAAGRRHGQALTAAADPDEPGTSGRPVPPPPRPPTGRLEP